ncbi:MAG: hypothetical protein WC326_08355 [Candidatus Delongbacteria bacterium]
MTRFAADTTVPAERSRAEIEQILTRYGASEYMYGWREENAVVQFHMAGRHIRFVLPLPSKQDPAYTRTPARGKQRDPEAAERAWEQATRQRWRALALVIKAKLEAVDSGITTTEQEFLAHTVLPDGCTVGEHSLPMIRRAYETCTMVEILPMLLPASGGQPRRS